MSILTFDTTGTPITVQCQRGGHAAPRRAGVALTSYAGEETASLWAELMVVPVVLVDLVPATVASIRALFACGAQVSCSGDVFNKGSVTIVCSATFSDEFEPAGPWFGLSMTLYEVGSTLPDLPVPDVSGESAADAGCAGLYWWYDAQAITGRANLSQMSWWADRSGYGRTATAHATAPNQPVYHASSPINGHPAVRFLSYGGNGRGYFMPGTFTAISTEAHLFIVSAPEARSNPYHLGSTAFAPEFPAETGDIQDHFGSSVSRAVGPPGVDPTEGFVYHAHTASGLWEAHVGLTLKLTSASNTVSWGGGPQMLGCWAAGGALFFAFQGYIGEFKVYCGPLSSGAVTAEITALGAKWGITV